MALAATDELRSRPRSLHRVRQLIVILLALIVVTGAVAAAAWYFHPINRYKRQLTSLFQEAVTLSERGMWIVDRHRPPGRSLGFSNEWRSHVADWEALDAKAARSRAPDGFPKTHRAAVAYIHEMYLSAKAISTESGGYRDDSGRHARLAIESAEDFRRFLKEELAAQGWESRSKRAR